MPLNLFLEKTIFILLAFLLLSKISPTYAAVIFSDTFSGGYNSSWQIAPGSYSPIPSTHGIGASPDGWSDILLPVNHDNTAYKLEFDLWININYVNSAFRTYVKNDPLTYYKIVNNWGPDNLLQLSENNPFHDALVTWNHDIGQHHFEIIFPPTNNSFIIVKEDGIERARLLSMNNFDIAHIGLGLLGYGDYEMSNFILSTEPITTPTPTAIPTPTPTPTSEATDTVVVIPGMGQSWNADALTHCKDENYDGDWTLASWAEDTYQPLLDSFDESALSPIPYYYDWRKQVTSHTTDLATFISDLTAPTERIDLVGHSMGGLVGRAYLEEQGDSHKLNKFLTAGSPHGGAAFAYPAWSGGEIWLGNLPERIGMTLLLKACGLLTNQREIIQSHIPSVQNVLPTEDYLRNHSTGLLTPVNTMAAQNNWLPTSLGSPFFGATVGTLAGINERTLEIIDVRNRTRRDEMLGNWADGKPMGRNDDGNGDGLVLPNSAQLPDADNRLITQSHSKLVSSQAGIAEIHDFLGISTPLTITQTEEPTRALVVVANPSIFWVEDPSGQVKKDKAGSITFFDPPAGNYKLRLVPTSSETTLFVGQFLANGKYLWKDYTFKNFLPKFSTIEFDPTTLLENPLK